MVQVITPDGEVLSFCYEAGACGYGLYRQLNSLGHECMVIAPSLIPSKPGDRVKTDRRDSESLARLHRAGELTAVWMPDMEQEAVRDLTRAREDMKHLERQSRQRLNAFLFRMVSVTIQVRVNGRKPIIAGWNNKDLITQYNKLFFRNISML